MLLLQYICCTELLLSGLLTNIFQYRSSYYFIVINTILEACKKSIIKWFLFFIPWCNWQTPNSALRKTITPRSINTTLRNTRDRTPKTFENRKAAL